VTMAAQSLVAAGGTPVSLVCSVCGYGIVRPVPPGHCPMCGTSDGWVHSLWHPFGRSAGDTLDPST